MPGPGRQHVPETEEQPSVDDGGDVSSVAEREAEERTAEDHFFGECGLQRDAGDELEGRAAGGVAADPLVEELVADAGRRAATRDPAARQPRPRRDPTAARRAPRRGGEPEVRPLEAVGPCARRSRRRRRGWSRSGRPPAGTAARRWRRARRAPRSFGAAQARAHRWILP